MVGEELKTVKVRGLDGYLGFLDGLVEGIAKDLSLDESVCSDIVMSISEALNNAYVHGHKMDKDKEISLSVFATPSELSFVVTDQGPGYDYAMFHDDLTEELLDVPGGRGLFIMRALAKDVLINEQGNQVTLVFERAA
jgi:serine/threonine-protein kinase RsbW